MNIERSRHVPVMLEEVLQFLRPAPGGLYIDATLGGGGHTRALLEHSAPDGKVLGIDTDVQALERARAQFSAPISDGRLVLAQGNFAEISSIASAAGFTAVQGVVLDLGFSSDQMDDPQRGFSFSADGPLDMRMDQSLTISAADLVNGAREQELADIFWRYGEERRSRQIARRIVQAREIHPATRVFQALRIAVNHELERLATALPQIIDILDKRKTSGMRGEEGRMVIISFHSLEDRIVKEFMRREASDCLCPPHTPVCVCGHRATLRPLTSKPVVATLREVKQNPRARSAKLRAAKVVVDS